MIEGIEREINLYLYRVKHETCLMKRREKTCIDIITGRNKKEGIFERNG